MLDLNLIRREPEKVKEGLRKRGEDPAIVDEILALDQRRRALIQQVEQLRAERNRVSKQIPRISDPAEREAKIQAMRELGERLKVLEQELRQVEDQLQERLAWMPNLPADDVPVGKDESDNVVLRQVGEIPTFDFQPLPHWDLGPKLGIIDFERGVKLSGTRFYVLRGAGARLQRALIQWMLDLHIRQGYLEHYPPFMVRERVVFASGQLPKFRDNLYHDAEEDFWWVPTAEVPLTGLHMDEILSEEQLPLYYTAYTPCFRREKMSAGKDVRGMKRGHQFDKVELYKYTTPETSDEELEKMLADVEETVRLLGLTYRVVLLSTGDLGFAARKTYDIEVWAPGVGEWLEVSSISNVGDFQARRANIRYRPKTGGRPRYVHTLNGSGLGLPRTMIAILETYQQPDGSVVVPEVLRPYMGGLEVIRGEEA
ncbi:MAG: serine--tRNA ligase [Chloroflexi bacterium]|nr:serine--tRNA ligase [Chloroflexota bacterium]